MRNKIDEILNSLPKDELENVYWSIKFIQEDYLFKKNLLDKGVIITELFEGAEEIEDLWDNTFAKNINEEMRESIHYTQHKWHIFSYEKQECLKEVAARKAFDVVSKNELYVMYQDSPYVIQCNKANKVIAADFDSRIDIYIFDKNFTWTYVHTHESMCGPYFYKKVSAA
ncbi:DUF4275 family protein [Sporosarcina sp. E16_8]|uniref:DUF4275 family protein n=1 Tax=Sporosarcina sp. E16_8 TaxID=2789295 RepID=UPI0021065ABA|nr:DUF4275 family protein [Sporosarcina sp. E16_8]